MDKKNISLIVLVIVLIAAGYLVLKRQAGPEASLSSTTPTPSITPDMSDLIRVEYPVSGQLISSPVKIKGEARGFWFFEASFPARIYDGNGTELGVMPIMTADEWMTENFVSFEARLDFKKPATENGTLVLEKDNPSGLPEHDAQIRIPVRFDLANWKDAAASGKCYVAGCSAQLCVEESEKDIITTCEFKEEYACYKDAQCERQTDGKCGWTPNEELVACLYTAWEKDSAQ
jgi:hypothetical protein